MAAAKARLKAAKDAIAARDWARAKSEAEGVVDLDPGNYTAYVFVGRAAQMLSQFQESEEAYRTAISFNGDQPLAWQGLANLFEEQKSDDKLEEVYRKLQTLYLASKDGRKLYDVINKLADLFLRTKAPDQWVEVWMAFTSGSPFYDALRSVQGIPDELAAWRKIAEIQEQEDLDTIRREVETRRRRLGADPLAVLKAKVENEVYAKSKLAESYESILALSKSSELAEVQSKLLVFLMQKLAAVEASQKSDLRTKVINTAVDLLGGPNPSAIAYEIMIESADVKDPSMYDRALLRSYLSHFPGTPLAKSVEGYLIWQEEGPVERAIDLCIAGADDSPSSIFCHYTLAWLYHEHREYSSGLYWAQKCKDLISEQNTKMGLNLAMTDSVDLCIANCLLYDDVRQLPDALAIYLRLLEANPQDLAVLQGAGKVLVRQCKYAEATKMFERALGFDPCNHETKAELGWVHFLEDRYEDAIRLLSEAVDGCLEGETNARSLYHYRLGRVYWAMNDFEESYTRFITSARISPGTSHAFTYLGHYYRQQMGDHARAKKCYQKAAATNPVDEEAVAPLTEYYMDEEEFDRAEELLKVVCDANQWSAWAWKRLGFIDLRRAEYNDAINAFQTSLRSNVKDTACWEALADVYRHEGRYMAAMRAFSRAKELEPSSAFATYQIAEVQRAIGMYGEAIDQYASGLESSVETGSGVSLRLPYLIGLSAAHIGFAQEHMQNEEFVDAAEHARKAVEVAADAVAGDPKLIGAWKVAGDAIVLFHRLPGAQLHVAPAESILCIVRAAVGDGDLDAHLKLPRAMDVGTVEQLATCAELTADLVLSSATLVFKRVSVLTLAGQRRQSKGAYGGAHWFDLGLMYYLRYRACCGIEGKGRGFLVAAARLARAAVHSDPANGEFWNALGVYTISDAPMLSQHAFIKAIQCDSKSASPWTNLGVLYMMNGDIELANQAFGNAQILDPDYAPAWVGRGLLASLARKAYGAED